MSLRLHSTILTLPGIGSSGSEHWQTLWEHEYGFVRVEQKDWETPLLSDWVEAIHNTVSKYDPKDVILVGHSAVCTAIAYWVQRYNIKVKAALLVAPADPEAGSFPQGATGFSPIPLMRLPFPSIVVTSTNDYFVTYERAKQFAAAWGSELINIGGAGHINAASGLGNWDEGLEILKTLDI